MELATLQSIQIVFWFAYIAACAIGIGVGLSRSRPGLFKCTSLLIAGSVAMTIYESFFPFAQWWVLLAIDIPIFGLVTAPPRYRVQAWLAGLILIQIVLHVIWGITDGIAGAGRLHWLGNIAVGFAKCAVLIFWAGGENAENAVSGFSRALARLVHNKIKAIQ
jgi:hypothetical protein